MSDLGQQLKEARLAKGLTLDDIQEMTKIRKRYLEAIEAGDYKVLPGSFYVRAFIKTYAEAVGIDAEELLNEHRDQVPTPAPEPTMEPVIQKRRSSRHQTERNTKMLSTTLMWSFFALILVVIYFAFTYWGGQEAGNDKQPDPTKVTQVKDPDAAQNTQIAEGDEVGKGTLDDSQGADGNDSVKADDENSAPIVDDSTPDVNGESPADDAATGTVSIVPDGKEGSVTKFKVQNGGSEPVPVVITASGKSWVEIRKGDRNGEKLFFGNTEEGDVLTYELGSEGIFILSGASPNTAITVGGQVVEDGKNTSRIMLSLDDGTATNNDSATDSDSSGNTGTENTTSGDATGAFNDTSSELSDDNASVE